MKYKLTILIFLLFGCSHVERLNRKIYKSQKECISNSPYNSAKGLTSDLKRQFKHNLSIAYDIYMQSICTPNDTIILKENYNFMCSGCSPYLIQYFYNSIVITYQKDNEKDLYKISADSLTSGYIDKNNYFYSDINEIMFEIRKGNDWNNSPLKYGTDSCFEGPQILYSIFYPSGKIESMYMRCWVDKKYRNK